MTPDQVPDELVQLAMEAAFPHLDMDRDRVRVASAEKHTRAALAAVFSFLVAYRSCGCQSPLLWPLPQPPHEAPDA